MEIQLDSFQQKIFDAPGNICVRSGRQIGKSTVISVKAGEKAVKNPNMNIMVIASVERQAQLLFEKILDYVYRNYKNYISKGKDRPTKHKLKLKNGSVIHCLPTGESGYGIRGFTIDLLIADEAAFIPEAVWTAVTPMLAATGGDTILLSTPFGRDGYYYRCFSDPKFTSFHRSSEDCPRIDKEFLAHEKEWMTDLQYAQEYLGEFVDKLRQFFSDGLLEEMPLTKKTKEFKGKVYMGVDIARMGKDETSLEIIGIDNLGLITHLDHHVTTKTKTTDTTRLIAGLHFQWNFSKIYIDSAGVGAGVYDQLREMNDVKRVVVSVENASKKIDGDKTKRVLKEELYDNLLKLMESRKIKLLDDPEIMTSLKSILYEYTETGKIKIYGAYSHIVEGLIRACWGIKDKSLKVYLY